MINRITLLLLFITSLGLSMPAGEEDSLPYYLTQKSIISNNLHVNFFVLHTSQNGFESFIPYEGINKANLLIKKMGMEFDELIVVRLDTMEYVFNSSNGFLIKSRHYGSYTEVDYEYNIPNIKTKTKDYRNGEESDQTKIELDKDRIRTRTNFKGSMFGGLSLQIKYLFDSDGKVVKRSSQFNELGSPIVTSYNYNDDNFITEEWGKVLDTPKKKRDLKHYKSENIHIIESQEDGIITEFIIIDNMLLKINRYNVRLGKKQLDEAVEYSYLMTNNEVINVAILDKYSKTIEGLRQSMKKIIVND